MAWKAREGAKGKTGEAAEFQVGLGDQVARATSNGPPKSSKSPQPPHYVPKTNNPLPSLKTNPSLSYLVKKPL